MTGALDGSRHHPLVLGTRARPTSGEDAPALADELPQQRGILIVYCFNLIGAELTELDRAATFAPL